MTALIPQTEPDNARRILLIGGCGYIGSYLYSHLEEAGYDIVVCDRLERGNPLNIEVIDSDYALLTADFLQQFSAVLWFGGHSSVGQAVKDPSGAVINNCLNLFAFAQKLSPATKFIYASTGSLYSTTAPDPKPALESSMAHIPTQNAYDMSKFAFDYLAQNFLGNFFALRMGTLAGHSPNVREELVFNSMNLSAVRTGQVHLKNSASRRTVLFLDDLWLLVNKLLTTTQTPGILNVGSVSFSVGELAQAVATAWNAEVVDEGESETYSFLLDTTRMQEICGTQRHVMALGSRCHQFVDAYKKAKAL